MNFYFLNKFKSSIVIKIFMLSLCSYILDAMKINDNYLSAEIVGQISYK